VIFSSHNPAEAQRHADRLLVLDRGRLVFDGTSEQLLERAGGATGDLEQALVKFLEEVPA
jgi:ABC-2 type transport system ATP-binding protein